MYSLSPCCFLCLQRISKNSAPKKEKISLQEIITFCCCEAVRVDEDTKIPIFVCNACRIHMTAFYTFKKIFVQNYNRWRKYISDLKHNSTSGNKEYTHLEVSLVDIKHTRTEIELLQNNLSSNDNINIDIKKTNAVAENKMKETVNEVIEYDASIDLQYDMYFKGNRNIKNIFHNDYTDFELPKNYTECNKTTINDSDAFQMNVGFHNAAKNAIKPDLYRKTVIDKDFQSLNRLIINEKSLDIPLDIKNEIITNASNETKANSNSFELKYNFSNIKKENIGVHDDYNNLYNSESLNSIEETTINLDFENEAKNYINNVNIKPEIDKYLPSTNSDFLLNEESLHIPFDIKDEIIQSPNEDGNENILISEDNFGIISNDFENNIAINNSDKNTNLHLSETEKSHNSNYRNKKLKNSKPEDELNICLICNKRFSGKKHLKRHIDTIHSEKQYKFSCDICNKKFRRNDQLKDHGKIHDKPYSCVICHKQFSQSSHLNDHLKIHSGDKPFKCEVCLKSFSQKSNYKIHFRIHSGEKPFSCSFCEKRFFSSNDMLRHERIHTQDFKHKCSVCDKKFNENSKLKRHLQVHQKKNNTRQT